LDTHQGAVNKKNEEAHDKAKGNAPQGKPLAQHPPDKKGGEAEHHPSGNEGKTGPALPVLFPYRKARHTIHGFLLISSDQPGLGPARTIIYGDNIIDGWKKATIPHYASLSPFKIAKYETTYELWYEVKTWADSNGYSFANAGREDAGILHG
jgi:hypothetical protein